MFINHQFACISCGNPMSTQLIRCPNPNCGCDYGYLNNPTPKHRGLVLNGTVELGNGPGKFNASFDSNGLASHDKLIRFTVAFGHRTQISSGPGRPANKMIVAYVPEIIGSGVSKYHVGMTPVSGMCILSPASPVWGHTFPVMDQWMTQKAPTTPWKCATCPNCVYFGQVFCPACYQAHGSDWRTFNV